MAVYQVNQGKSFEREWAGRYLCCPDGSRGGHNIMRSLVVGDLIVHYARSRVRGVSRVVDLRVDDLSAVYVRDGEFPIRAIGAAHLSLEDFSGDQREGQKKYGRWQVVRIEHCLLPDHPSFETLPHHSFQGYLRAYEFEADLWQALDRLRR